MNKVLLIFIFCISFNLNAFAKDIQFAVKVSSGPCGSINSQMKGSGSLFTYKGETYVLTSEHVVYHSTQEKFCHSVSNSFINDQKATLLFADWGLGIALLKISLPPSSEFLSFPQDFIPSQNPAIKIAGSPYSDKNGIIFTNGQIINEEGTRLPTAMLKYSLEIDGAHGEFGMSGGPIFEETDNKAIFRGILSHQVLVMNPGAPSRASEWDASQKYQNQLLGIKVEDVNKALNRYFQNPAAFKVSFFRTPIGQINHTNEIVSNGLSFKPKIQVINKSFNVQLRRAGGVDPIGIGGEDDDSDGVFISLDMNSFSGKEEFHTEWMFSASQTSVEKIKNLIFANQKVELPFLLFQDQEDSNNGIKLTSKKLRSIDDYFSFLSDNRFSMVIRNLTTSLNQKNKDLGQSNLELLKTFSLSELQVENQSYFIALTTLSIMAAEDNLDMVNCKYLMKLSSREPDVDHFWAELLDYDFNVSTKLLQNVKYFTKQCK